MNKVFESLQLRPTSWEDAAAAAVDHIVDCVTNHPGMSYLEIRQEFNAAEREFSKHPGAHYHMASNWAKVGHAAMVYSNNSGRGKLDKEILTGVLIKKQRDYGKNNILRYGAQGVFIRCHDKIARLENLLSSSSRPNNESIFDTLLDIAGYASIAIMLDMFTFELPMSQAADEQYL